MQLLLAYGARVTAAHVDVKCDIWWTRYLHKEKIKLKSRTDQYCSSTAFYKNKNFG